MRGHEFGEVVLVPFPFTDHATMKQRPAVVVSSTVVATIANRLAVRRLGRLDERDRSRLKRLLGWIFGE